MSGPRAHRLTAAGVPFGLLAGLVWIIPADAQRAGTVVRIGTDGHVETSE
jgi:hypothetical protein